MSADQAPLYIHVGYPKTGTTSLQHNLFEAHSGISRLQTLSNDMTYVEKNIIHSEESDFATRLEVLRTTVADAVTKKKGKAAVWSREGFTAIGDMSDLRNTAERIHKVVDQNGVQPKVLIVIRRQPDIILSNFVWFYNGLVYEGPYESIDEYVQYNMQHCREDFFSTLFYSRVVDEYVEHFGKENVRVMMFEEMKNDCRSFVEKISNFTKVDKTISFNALCGGSKAKKSARKEGSYLQPSRLYFIASQIKMKYLSEKFHFHQYKWGQWMIDKLKRFSLTEQKVEFDKSSVNQISNKYRSDNKKLFSNYNLNIDKYNYPL